MKGIKKMPKVGLVMTSFPYFVEAGDTASKIERIMKDHDIRHLPVQEKGEIVGIVSERDLHHFVKPEAASEDKARIKARDLMVADPYVVAFNTPLNEVVSGMASRHIGSAIVMRRGKLAGVLTAIDVCRILADYLEAMFPQSEGEAA
ncbi:MAG: CBS domain-containing protein [Deltaproteobacteria bacterium]|nr:CBS domain-containing protein [Deltaproteobacteria bacterium]